MTDNDIIKALECCGNQMYSCTDKRCKAQTLGNALNLINRQKAEIERLRMEAKTVDKRLEELDRPIAEIRAEAITDFAEKLKEKAKMGKGYLGNVYHTVDVCYIDQIAKELKGTADETKRTMPDV